MTDAMTALERARKAWERTQQQTQLDLDPDPSGLDETHADTSPLPPPGGRVRLVEPDGSTRSGAGPTPAKSSETHRAATHGSSFRQSPAADGAVRVPGPRHLASVPDPEPVPAPIPIPTLLEVLEVLPWMP